MIIVGNERFPSEDRWNQFLEEEAKKNQPQGDYNLEDYGSDFAESEDESEAQDDPSSDFEQEVDDDDDMGVAPGFDTPSSEDLRISGRQPGLSDKLHVFLKKEWNELETQLQDKLGAMELSVATKNHLKAQIGIDRGTTEEGQTRLDSVFELPDGVTDDMVDDPDAYNAQPMPFEEAADKLSAGKFSSMSEMAWVIYNAGGHKAGGGYTSANSEKKLSTRPNFSTDTEKEREQYVRDAGKGPKEVDLRHIISSTTLNKALASSNDDLKDINAFLKRHDREGKHKDILPAKVEVFEMAHSHLGNLWPGGAADNQAAGTMHGKLNFDARTEAARMPKADESVQAQNSKGAKKKLSPIEPDEHVSDCQVNRFLTELGKLDDAFGKEVQEDKLANKVVNFNEVYECAKLIGELNDEIRGRIGVSEDGYTVGEMEQDLNDWLSENPDQAGDSLKAKLVTKLRQLCQNEADSLKQLQVDDVDNAAVRVDDCDLTGHIQKLRARGEVSQGEKDFLTAMNVNAEDAVITDRQESQTKMVNACIDYLQARSVTCDKLRNDGNDTKGYTQKDLVGDLENLAANFDFDLANSIIPALKPKSYGENYTTKLIGVEKDLLEAKAGTNVSLFKEKNGQPSTMDQFMNLDYKKQEVKMDVAVPLDHSGGPRMDDADGHNNSQDPGPPPPDVDSSSVKLGKRKEFEGRSKNSEGRGEHDTSTLEVDSEGTDHKVENQDPVEKDLSPDQKRQRTKGEWKPDSKQEHTQGDPDGLTKVDPMDVVDGKSPKPTLSQTLNRPKIPTTKIENLADMRRQSQANSPPPPGLGHAGKQSVGNGLG